MKTINVLVLFSGTKSVEKVLDTYDTKKYKFNHYSVDLDKRHKPSFNVDIMKWNYKKDLKNIRIDYLHSSFVCREFSNLKTGNNRIRDLDFGYSLITKTLEIYNYLKHINPNIIITMENPVNKYLRNYNPLSTFNRYETSYCKYGYPYQKNTWFWSNIELKLKERCYCKSKCDFKNKHNYHRVRIGYVEKTKYPLQISDSQYLKEYKQLPNRDLMITNGTYLRYRIPSGLIKDIIKSVLEKYEEDEEIENEVMLEISDFYEFSFNINPIEIVIQDEEYDNDYLDFIDYPDTDDLMEEIEI